MALQSFGTIQVNYLLNLGSILVIKSGRCPPYSTFEPSLDECVFISEEEMTLEDASRVCKEKGKVATVGIIIRADNA